MAGLGRYCRALLLSWPCCHVMAWTLLWDDHQSKSIVMQLWFSFFLTRSKRLTRHGLSSGSQNIWLHFWHWFSLIQNRPWICASLFLHLQNRGSVAEAWGLQNVYVIMLQRCSYYLEVPPLLPQVDEIQNSSDMLLQCCKWRRDSWP